MNKKRQHISVLFSGIVSGAIFALIAAASVTGLFIEIKEPSTSAAAICAASVFGAILLLMCAVSAIKYLFTFYYEQNETLVCEFSFIFHKKAVIPYDKIDTVNTERKITNFLFGSSILRVDTGSVSSSIAPEIEIVVGKDQADQLEKYIRERAKGAKAEDGGTPNISTPESDNYLYFGTAKMIAAALLQPNRSLLYVMFVLSVTIISAAIGLFATGDIGVQGLTLSVVLGPLGSVALSIAISVVAYVLKYYGFTLRREGKYIKVEYGLFDKKEYTLPVERINCVTFKQNIIQRVFRRGSVNVSVVGFAGSAAEDTTNYICPLTTCGQYGDLVALYLPEFVYGEADVIKAPKYSVKYYFVMPSLICAALFALSFLPVVFSKYAFIAPAAVLVVSVVLLIRQYLKYRMAEISVTDRHIRIVNGGLGRNAHTIKKGSVQHVERSSTVYRLRKKLCSYAVHIKSNITETRIATGILPDMPQEELELTEF